MIPAAREAIRRSLARVLDRFGAPGTSGPGGDRRGSGTPDGNADDPGPLARAREDVRAVLDRDPAAGSAAEVALTYPGVHAVWIHRVAGRALAGGHPLLARALSNLGRALTGVDVHPAADLGRRVTIDHGTGVVVGETATVGDDCHLLHGVTLGATDDRPVERHPTLGDGVTVGARATLLGPIEVGDEATVGAGAVVTDDVPAGATVAGVPAEVIDGGEDAERTATPGPDPDPGRDRDAGRDDPRRDDGERDEDPDGKRDDDRDRGDGDPDDGNPDDGEGTDSERMVSLPRRPCDD